MQIFFFQLFSTYFLQRDFNYEYTFPGGLPSIKAHIASLAAFIFE